jgi:hypothetical protein
MLFREECDDDSTGMAQLSHWQPDMRQTALSSQQLRENNRSKILERGGLREGGGC